MPRVHLEFSFFSFILFSSIQNLQMLRFWAKQKVRKDRKGGVKKREIKKDRKTKRKKRKMKK